MSYEVSVRLDREDGMVFKEEEMLECVLLSWLD